MTSAGVFGPRTEASVREFQRLYAIATNGIVGPVTWAWLVSVRNALMVSASGTAAGTRASEGFATDALLTPEPAVAKTSIPATAEMPSITSQELMFMALLLHGLNR